MKKSLIIFSIFILTIALNVEVYANKYINGQKSSVHIILESIHKLNSNDVKQKLYLEAAKKLGKEKDFDQFKELLSQLPEELIVYQRKLYESFFYEFNSISSLAVVKQKILQINESNLKDYIVERICYQALTEEKDRQYDILLPLVTQNVIRSRVILLLIEYYIKINQTEKANNLVDGIAFPAQKDAAYSLLAIGYAKSADYERSNLNINNIVDNKIKQGALSLVLNEFIKKSMYKISFELLNRISNQDNYEKALITLINQYLNEKKYDTAYQLFQSIKNNINQQNALYSLAIGFSKNGELEGLENVLKLITEESFKDQTLHDSAIKFAELGMAEEAIDLVLSISNYTMYESALLAVSSELGVADNVSFVILKLQQIKEDDFFTKAIEHFLYSLIKNKKIDEVEKAIEYIKNLGKILQNYNLDGILFDLYKKVAM